MSKYNIFLFLTVLCGCMGLVAMYEFVDAIMRYRSAWLVFANITQTVVFMVLAIENFKRLRGAR